MRSRTNSLDLGQWRIGLGDHVFILCIGREIIDLIRNKWDDRNLRADLGKTLCKAWQSITSPAFANHFLGLGIDDRPRAECGLPGAHRLQAGI